MAMVEVSLYPGEQPGFLSVASAILSKNCLLPESNDCRLFFTYLYFIPWNLRSFALPNTLISKISFRFRFSKHGTFRRSCTPSGIHVLCFRHAGLPGLRPCTSRGLALHVYPCSLTSIRLFISQVFIEHLVISGNLTLCAIIRSYATGQRRAALSDLTWKGILKSLIAPGTSPRRRLQLTTGQCAHHTLGWGVTPG